MRVISGSARGKKLGELSGEATRPTTDRVKEAMFNIIQFSVPGARVLDLFGGTGQLGIECLSRGAESCTFVDAGKQPNALIRKNLADCHLEAQAEVVQMDSISYLTGCGRRYDLIFLDPPYAADLLERALARIAEIDILSEDGIIVCESPAEKQLPALNPPYRKGKEYRYGQIKLTTYRRDG